MAELRWASLAPIAPPLFAGFDAFSFAELMILINGLARKSCHGSHQNLKRGRSKWQGF